MYGHDPNAVPFQSKALDIQDDWIDYNGHLNMAYYLVMFEKAFDDFHFVLGITTDYVKNRKMTTYTGQTKIDYLREVHKNAELTATCQLVDYDEKRLHTWQELKFPDGTIAATCETLTLHIDASGPKVAPFPDDILAKVQAVFERHKSLPVPEKARRSIGIAHKAGRIS